MAQPNTIPEADLWSLLEAVPSHFKAEIIDGTLHVNPAPSAEHQHVNDALTVFVGGPHMFDPSGPSGWWILSAPGVRVRVKEEFSPDHAGWRKSKLSFLPSIITTAPDWVCEVLSPGNAKYDRETKMPFYARLGIEWAWLVDTDRRLIEVYRLSEDRYVPVSLPSGSVRLPPFEGIVLPIDRFWL